MNHAGRLIDSECLFQSYGRASLCWPPCFHLLLLVQGATQYLRIRRILFYNFIVYICFKIWNHSFASWTKPSSLVRTVTLNFKMNIIVYLSGSKVSINIITVLHTQLGKPLMGFSRVFDCYLFEILIHLQQGYQL